MLDYLGISYWKTLNFVSRKTTFSSKGTKRAITFIDLYSSKTNFKIQNLSIILFVPELNNSYCYLKVRESNWRYHHKWYIYDNHNRLPSETYWRWSNICWYLITIVSVKYTIMRTCHYVNSLYLCKTVFKKKRIISFHWLTTTAVPGIIGLCLDAVTLIAETRTSWMSTRKKTRITDPACTGFRSSPPCSPSRPPGAVYPPRTTRDTRIPSTTQPATF